MRTRSVVWLSAIAVIHSAIWAVALPALRFPYPPRTAVAQYLSTLVLVLASSNLLLATRARPAEAAFNGLDKMFAAHRLVGVTAACAIAGHVLLVPITVPILPGRAIGIATFVLVEASVILAIAPRAPWRHLLEVRYETWKAEHRFMGLFVLAAVMHSTRVPTLVREMPLVSAWVYGCAFLGLVAYAYRETWFRYWARRHRYAVSTAEELAGGTLEVHLDPAHAPIKHRAGQFGFVRFDAGPSHERHPFTIASAPVDSRALRFAIHKSGDYTAKLQDGVPEGSSASVEGPYGRFDFTRGRQRQLWLVGGIGITPFLAFLPVLDPEREVTLLWSVRHPDEAVFREELEAAAARLPNLRPTIWPTAEKGHVALADLGLERPEELSVYLCGPVVMRESFIEQLHALGVRERDIHYEEFTLR